MTFEDAQQFLSDHQETIILLAGLSLGAFVVSVVVLPLVLIALPADYFVRPPGVPKSHSVIRAFLKILKNTLGIILLMLGFIMLFIPGQGILTMLFGVGLMDFPRKRELQLKIARSPKVHHSLDWLRRKADKPVFDLPDP